MSRKNDELTGKIRGSCILMLCTFLLSVFSLFFVADSLLFDEKRRGSMDALGKMEDEYLTDVYVKYMENPHKTNVFMILLERGLHNGELR